MSELRAPDPTLTALDPHTCVGVRWDQAPVPVAHSLSRYPEGDPIELLQAWPTCDPEMEEDKWRDVPVESAAWFAVPCRECFPAAPPPGSPGRCCEHEGCPNIWSRSPGLAWQVRP